MKRILILCTLILAALVPTAQAAPPGIINHQGRIAVGGVNFDGTGHFKFALVDGAGTTSFWSNDGSSTGGGEPTASISLAVSKGHYAVALGESTAVPASVFAENDDVRLRVWFSQTGGAGTFELLSPDRRVTSAGYALSAAGVANGVITDAMLADGAITSAKLAPGAVSGLDSPDGRLAGVVRVDDGGVVGIGSAADPLDGLPSNPFEVASVDISGASNSPQSVAVAGDYAYVVDEQTDKLHVFDVSDPASPLETGSVDVSGASNFPISVAVVGDHAYVVDEQTDKLHIFDVSDPASPSETGSVKISGTPSYPRSVAVAGDHAYVVDVTTDKLHVFDVSDPASPSETGSVDISGASNEPWSVAVAGGHAYVVDLVTDKLHVFDVSDPANPSETGSVDISGASNEPWSVAVGGGHAYVVDNGTDKLHVFDVSNPASPSESASVDIPGASNFPRSVELEGKNVYVVDDFTDKLHIFDVSDPANPSEAGSVDISGALNTLGSVAVGGGYAYVVDLFTGKLHVFEVAPAVAVHGSVQIGSGGGVIFSDGSVQTRAFGPDDLNRYFLEDGSETFGGDLDLGGHDLLNGGRIEMASSASQFAVLERLTSGTDSLQGVVRVQATTSGNMIDGLGPVIEFAVEDNAGTPNNLGGIGAQRASADNTGDLIFYNRVAGNLHRHMELRSNGDLRIHQELRVGTEFGNDDDSIYFDNGTSERLFWHNSADRFELSNDLHVAGVVTETSDRDSKEQFAAVDHGEILDKVAAMPITTWQFKDDPGRTRHLGPMAQDFHAAFGVGSDERRIAKIDADGVALAAIKGLNAKLEAENAAKNEKIAELERRLQALETLITNIKPTTGNE